MEIKIKKPPMVLIGAKVPAELREQIQLKAKEEERSLSQTILRLLSTHPRLQAETTSIELAK